MKTQALRNAPSISPRIIEKKDNQLPSTADLGASLTWEDFVPMTNPDGYEAHSRDRGDRPWYKRGRSEQADFASTSASVAENGEPLIWKASVPPEGRPVLETELTLPKLDYLPIFQGSVHTDAIGLGYGNKPEAPLEWLIHTPAPPKPNAPPSVRWYTIG